MASKPMSKAERERRKAQQRLRSRIHENWRARHPKLADDERQLRRDHKAAERDFGHKVHGTVETLQKASRTRQGAMARLFQDGHLTADQLAFSQAIRGVVERIGADVAIGTVSLETRVDGGRRSDGSFFERLGQVRSEVAYGRWRQALGPASAAIVLEMIVQDVSPNSAGRIYGKRPATCRTLLVSALNHWGDCIGVACSEIDEATLLAAQAAIF